MRFSRPAADGIGDAVGGMDTRSPSFAAVASFYPYGPSAGMVRRYWPVAAMRPKTVATVPRTFRPQTPKVSPRLRSREPSLPHQPRRRPGRRSGHRLAMVLAALGLGLSALPADAASCTGASKRQTTLTAGAATPGSGTTSTTFAFSVRYADSAGCEPSSVVLMIAGVGNTTMTTTGSDFQGGVVYRASRRLPAGVWTYRFRATSGKGQGERVVTLDNVSPASIKVAAPQATPKPTPKPTPEADAQADRQADAQADAEAHAEGDAEAARPKPTPKPTPGATAKPTPKPTPRRHPSRSRPRRPPRRGREPGPVSRARRAAARESSPSPAAWRSSTRTVAAEVGTAAAAGDAVGRTLGRLRARPGSGLDARMAITAWVTTTMFGVMVFAWVLRRPQREANSPLAAALSLVATDRASRRDAAAEESIVATRMSSYRGRRRTLDADRTGARPDRQSTHRRADPASPAVRKGAGRATLIAARSPTVSSGCPKVPTTSGRERSCDSTAATRSTSSGRRAASSRSGRRPARSAGSRATRSSARAVGARPERGRVRTNAEASR